MVHSKERFHKRKKQLLVAILNTQISGVLKTFNVYFSTVCFKETNNLFVYLFYDKRNTLICLKTKSLSFIYDWKISISRMEWNQHKLSAHYRYSADTTVLNLWLDQKNSSVSGLIEGQYHDYGKNWRVQS